MGEDIKDRMGALKDESTKKIFKEILKSRILSHKELAERLELPPDAMKNSLKELKKAELIDFKESSVIDWNKYFVTERGLAAARILQ